MFIYEILDETGKKKMRNIHLTHRNIDTLTRLLTGENVSGGRDLYDGHMEGYAYEGDVLPIPSLAIIMSFTIMRFKDRYGKDLEDPKKRKNYRRLNNPFDKSYPVEMKRKIVEEKRFDK